MIGQGTRLARRLRASRLARNAFSLYALQIGQFAVLALTVPYLSRVLGPAAWGQVAFMQAAGLYLSAVVEFGFNFSAVRDLAASRDSGLERSRIVGEVITAKLILAFLGVLAALAIRPWIPLMANDPFIFYSGLAWGVAQGLGLHWYFQALERMRSLVIFDLSVRAASVLCIFLVVDGPSEGWLVLATYAAGSIVVLGIGVALVARDTPFRLVGVRRALSTIRYAAALFAYRASLLLYATGNAFILGLLAPARAVGYFAASEKLMNAAAAISVPISQAFFARSSYLVRHDRRQAARYVTILLVVLSAWGLTVAVGIWIAAPILVPFVLGDGFLPAVPVLRILAFALPLSAISACLGIQWAIPLGRERAYIAVVFFAGIVNVVLAVILVPLLGPLGMAIAVVMAEGAAALGVLVALRQAGLLPWRWLSDVREDTRVGPT